MIKWSIHQEDITIVNISAPKYIKQILINLKGEKKIIAGDFNTPLSAMDQ